MYLPLLHLTNLIDFFITKMRPLTLRVVVLHRVTIGGIQNTCEVGKKHITPWSGVIDR